MGCLPEITAAILAGGLGTRLRTAVSDRPKVLAPVNGRPFVAYLLDHLARQGVPYTILLTGYLGEMIERTIGHCWKGMRISYSHENAPLDTGGALRLAMPFFRTGRVLVMNGDSFFAVDLQALNEQHGTSGARLTMVLTSVEDVSRYGELKLDGKGRVAGFMEKRAGGGKGLINAGIYLVETDLIAEIPPDRSVSLERQMFQCWIGKGFYGYAAEGRFLDIGLPETYARAGAFCDSLDAQQAFKGDRT